jgi:hypothetical protein
MVSCETSAVSPPQAGLKRRGDVIYDYFCTVATDSGGTWRKLVELAGMPWWRLRYQSDIDNHTLATDFVGSNAY